jgi:hypothetical protein
LDCEEIIPSFLLIYLVFLGMFQLLDKLIEIFKDLMIDAKGEIKHHL